MFGDVKLTINANPDKYKYSGYGIGFDTSRSFSLSDGSVFDKSVIIFSADMSSSVHINYKKKYLTSWQRSNARVRQNYIKYRKRMFHKFD